MDLSLDSQGGPGGLWHIECDRPDGTKLRALDLRKRQAPLHRTSAESVSAMIQINPNMRLLTAVEPVDFRKGIDGMAALCRQKLDMNSFRNVQKAPVKAGMK